MSESFDFKEVTGAWDYRTCPDNVRIGRDCWIERKESFQLCRTARRPGLVLADRVKVFTWTTFNIEPTGYVEVGEDSVLVGPVFMCAERISIGQRVVISYHVTIADSDFHPLNPDDRKRDAIANAPCGDREQRPALVTSPVVVEDDVWIGIGAII